MGGCVSGCMSAMDKGKQVEHDGAKKTKAIETFSVEIDDPVGPNESKIRRSPSQAKIAYAEWRAQFYGAQYGSAANMIAEAVKKNGAKPGIAWRPVDKVAQEDIEQPNGKMKKFDVTYLGERKSMDYTAFWKNVNAFGRGLAAIGVKAGDPVGLYEETRAEWMTACLGIWTQNMVGVTVYANLGDDALLYAMKEAELSYILCNGKAAPKLVKLCASAGVAVPTIIYTDALPAGAEIPNAISFAAVIEKGGDAPIPESYNKDPDQRALIMYTSGTTGDPKGVVMSHGNVVAAVLGFERIISSVLTNIDSDDAYVAYLPLAHILEFAAQLTMIRIGVTIAYGNARTLTNTYAKPHGDLMEFKPRFFAGVPRIYDTIKKAVMAKLPKDGVQRAVFDRAFEDRKAAMAEGKDTPYYNEKVFKRFRDMLGGRVSLMASGAAPLSAETQTFMEVIFGVSIAQGYGLTETCASTTLQKPFDTRRESIGGLNSVAEIKLRDADVWKHTDQPHPRGEILIRGPTVTQGYYKQPEKTAEVFGADGWFATGDVGEILADGTLKIIGRTKALAKNLLGEYVALEALESVYCQNEIAVPNGVCVLVNPQRAYIAAIVLTDESKATRFAAENGIAGEFPAFLTTAAFEAKVLESFGKTADSFKRKPFEKLKAVRVLNEEWTPENGVLTAAMKLKRRVVDEKYKDIIEALFVNDS